MYFKSICSSSAGNCLTLWTENSRLIIDCGLRTIKNCRKTFAENFTPVKDQAVLVSHTHSDHISHYPLRFLQDIGHPLMVSQLCIGQLAEKHFKHRDFSELDIAPFDTSPFTVGDFQITPFRVTHHPAYPTFGFKITSAGKSAIITTDLNSAQANLHHFLDADFIFIESNHDLELLKKYANPNSHYHMSNPKTAELLLSTVTKSRKKPHTIMLGHISDQRNTPEKALDQVLSTFKKHSIPKNFNLSFAPLFKQSETIEI